LTLVFSFFFLFPVGWEALPLFLNLLLMAGRRLSPLFPPCREDFHALCDGRFFPPFLLDEKEEHPFCGSGPFTSRSADGTFFSPFFPLPLLLAGAKFFLFIPALLPFPFPFSLKDLPFFLRVRFFFFLREFFPPFWFQGRGLSPFSF